MSPEAPVRERENCHEKSAHLFCSRYTSITTMGGPGGNRGLASRTRSMDASARACIASDSHGFFKTRLVLSTPELRPTSEELL